MPAKFYVADHDLSRTPGHAYFTSSMWAVARFEVSNGLSDRTNKNGTNKTCYRYENAMLNTEGRGFQGFKTIVAEEQLQVAAGETPPTSSASCGDGPGRPNKQRTTKTFPQEFPLHNRLESDLVENAAKNQLVD